MQRSFTYFVTMCDFESLGVGKNSTTYAIVSFFQFSQKLSIRFI